MRIALLGKGGSGKTTVSSLLIRALMQQEKSVIAIDADVNQSLGRKLDISQKSIDAKLKIGDPDNGLNQLKALLKGSNQLIPENLQHMIKTTPPGPGSHLINPQSQDDPVLSRFGVTQGALTLINVGEVSKNSHMHRCYHAQTGGADLLLNHFLDSPNDNIIVDMTAGTDAFASGIFTRFDLLLLVVEPTDDSIDVYRQYIEHADFFDQTAQKNGVHSAVRPLIKVVGNKLSNPLQRQQLEYYCGEDLIGFLSESDWIKNQAMKQWLEVTQRETLLDFDVYEKENLSVLHKVLNEGHRLAHKKDWMNFWQQAIYVHKAQQSWAGEDILEHYNEAFLEGLMPSALHAAQTNGSQSMND